ncbi:DUF2243 domain-containing protein [Halopelagius longus]|uniref:DUF2243 domain-containing protein n=1 Tax=Halopelagius longus TaxID=1236180 RepID=A0A1H1EKN6_9EURY|nr:DUF2243 domain-containing protein [Halopelagius longus]RDI71798.1 DUF2243 domain-containing protein [Halopelagius longus]SDQ89351.1 Uncharacterized membrane protein [Halopelagius longus]
MRTHARRERPLLLGGGALGFGLGALFDVLLFHLVLQWHHLLSALYAPTTLSGLRTNVYFDGLFSLGALGVMTVGAAAVWRAVNRAERPHSGTRLVGSVLVGAGLFNVFDGVIDHYVLHIHDVVHGSEALNPHWVGASLLLVGVGILVLTESAD